MKYALITTTINIPYNLEAYCKDIAAYCPNQVEIIVAGDKKTPVEIEDFLENLQIKYDIEISYLAPEDQEKMYPEYSGFLGWNTIQRRNIAML